MPIVEAWVEVDPAGQPTRVCAQLDLARISTGNPRRDRDLRKPHLLDTARFPTMSFTAVSPVRASGGWQIQGRLEAHGHAAGLTLTTTGERILGPGTLGVRATASFDRRALGITAPRILIGRLVTVTVEAAFHQPDQ